MSVTKVIVCRKASSSLEPGAKRGYRCANCNIELQVTPTGQAQLAEGGLLLCNPCGGLFMRHKQPDAIYANPAAKRHFDGMNLASKSATPSTSNYQSLGTKIEVLPSGRMDAKETWGAKPDVPQRPDWLVCDCCSRKSDRLWFWSHYGFCLRVPGRRRVEYVAGHWAFCVFCKAAMDDPKLLAARVLTLDKSIDPEFLGVCYSTMLQCLYGEATEWQSGQPRGERL